MSGVVGRIPAPLRIETVNDELDILPRGTDYSRQVRDSKAFMVRDCLQDFFPRGAEPIVTRPAQQARQVNDFFAEQLERTLAGAGHIDKYLSYWQYIVNVLPAITVTITVKIMI